MTEPAVLTLTDFLLARIADDAWQAVGAVEYRRSHPGWEPVDRRWEMDDGLVAVGPERALADCEAKRRIVEVTSEVVRYGCWECGGLGLDWPVLHRDDCSGDRSLVLAEQTLLELASVYADHPDYRPEWAPHAVG